MANWPFGGGRGRPAVGYGVFGGVPHPEEAPLPTVARPMERGAATITPKQRQRRQQRQRVIFFFLSLF